MTIFAIISFISFVYCQCPVHVHATDAGANGTVDPVQPPQNQTGSARAKQLALWNEILADDAGAEWPSKLGGLLAVFTENLTVTTDLHSDLFPPNRTKVFHAVGAVALVSWRPTTVQHGYTGLFASGARYGLMRAGSSNKPSRAWWPWGQEQMSPGISLKLFRDNIESSNQFAIYALQPIHSFNFFEKEGVMNHIAVPNDLGVLGNLGKAKLETATAHAGLVGTSDMAMADEAGVRVDADEAQFPFGLIFQTNPSYRALFARTSSPDIGASLAQTEFADAHFCKVFAVDSPTWPPTLTHVGDIYLESEFRVSKFADTGIFFRHVFSEQDFALRPQWKKLFEEPTAKRSEKEGFQLYVPFLPRW